MEQGMSAARQARVTSSLKLELQDVRVRLETARAAGALACVNFIRSRLLLETNEDGGTDVDLVSQEILVSDLRFEQEPANKRGNVFTNIVQPMPERRHAVQAEVHARKSGECWAYTVLVNNMRLMAILDWWEAVGHFLAQPPLDDYDEPPPRQYTTQAAGAGRSQTELKLNITDSQLVLVEDPALWDSNAVILRSTTVVTYRASDVARPVWCELSELEVFSCVLGLEEETALAIVEPAALTASLCAAAVLHVSLGSVRLRLSYHDMRMFARMLHSLPEQLRAALSSKLLSSTEGEDEPANSMHMRAGARNGAAPAASAAPAAPATAAAPATPAAPARPSYWLRRPPDQPDPPQAQQPSIWALKAIRVTAECVTLCVIDDCLDSDVPLLEVALADMRVDQVRHVPPSSTSFIYIYIMIDDCLDSDVPLLEVALADMRVDQVALADMRVDQVRHVPPSSTSFIYIYIMIDDCLDSDVPLLEVALADMRVDQVRHVPPSSTSFIYIYIMIDDCLDSDVPLLEVALADMRVDQVALADMRVDQVRHVPPSSTSFIYIYIMIDDCLDSDVPLLEVALADMRVDQVRHVPPSSTSFIYI
ncbi:hypothetical protein ACJJTC_007643 [Scirpophaga incertulas]